MSDLDEILSRVDTLGLSQNVYIDLDGTIRPHRFPKAGLWKFDGQFYYLQKRGAIKCVN